MFTCKLVEWSCFVHMPMWWFRTILALWQRWITRCMDSSLATLSHSRRWKEWLFLMAGSVRLKVFFYYMLLMFIFLAGWLLCCHYERLVACCNIAFSDCLIRLDRLYWYKLVEYLWCFNAVDSISGTIIACKNAAPIKSKGFLLTAVVAGTVLSWGCCIKLGPLNRNWKQ